MKSFKEFLNESKDSDALERAVAKYIHSLGEKGGPCEGRIRAVRPTFNTTYSDVLINYLPLGTKDWKGGWLEIKMNHTDNLTNVRMFFKNGLWQCKTRALPTNIACDFMNKSNEVSEFMNQLIKFMNKKYPRQDRQDWNIRNIEIYSVKGDREGSKNAVTYEQLRDFTENERPNAYIWSLENIDVSKIARDYYKSNSEKEGKSAPAHYLQSADDLYRLSDENPLGWEYHSKLPLFEGKGNFKVRIGTRSAKTANHEIQPELKLAPKQASASDYSLKPGTSKKLPFKTNSEL